MRSILFFILVFSCIRGQAYIPPSHMILQRVAENHGSGVFQIDLEVTLRSGPDPIMLKETWISDGEKGLKVVAVGQGLLKDKFRFEAFYRANQRISATSRGKNTAGFAESFVEWPFHLRTSESLKDWLLKMEILPPNYETLKTHIKEKDRFIYPKESFMRLNRLLGVVNYQMGREFQDNSKPSAWIEQDQFHIRKIRWNKNLELTVDEVGSYAKGVHYPKQRTLVWNNSIISMRTLAVASKASAKDLSQVAASINLIDEAEGSALVSKFYSELR